MKIVFITPKFYPSVGGVERHCYEVGKKIIENGNELVVITESSPKIYHNNLYDYQSIAQSDTYSINIKSGVKSSYFAHYTIDNIKVFAFKFGNNGWFKKFRIWYYLYLNRDIIRDADVVHCHDVFIWYLPLRFYFFFKKVFITFHGYESYPIRKRAIVLRKISELLTSGNICVGDYIKKWYKTNPDYVIYGAVNIPQVHRSIKKPSALFYGRLDEQTGIIEYAKAVIEIKKKYVNFDFLVIGSGYLKNKLNKKIKVLDANINAKQYLKKYRFAFVSRYLSAMEAMAEKRLVFVMYDNPLKKDCFVLGPFKEFVVMVSSPEQLVEKVNYFLLHEDDERRMVDKAYKWVQNQRWDSVVEIYLKLWRK